ncbi:DUF2017 domain-containing protein [Glutamicibacter sp. MNS18]|uniref:DUF2017 domain-containing protein n=1 Tax=Glutamicibacter sp. MNS18 TaxID=2989817 RepID=UPI003531B6CD
MHEPERKLLRDLFDDVITLLEERDEIHRVDPAEDLDPLYALTGMSPDRGPLPEPSDPATARLLPVASDDEQVANEFRRFGEQDLIAAKIGRLREAQFLMENTRIVLDEAAASRFAQALNDVRLVLSQRLGIRDEQDSERIGQINDAAQVQTSQDYMALVYNLISWVQDTIMQALLDSEY